MVRIRFQITCKPAFRTSFQFAKNDFAVIFGLDHRFGQPKR
jgi:hypothetical protein